MSRSGLGFGRWFAAIMLFRGYNLTQHNPRLLESRFSRLSYIGSTAGLILNLDWGFRDVNDMKVRVPI